MSTNKSKAYVSNENISVPLFKNKWVDRFTRTHIAIPVSLFFLYAFGLILYTQMKTNLTNYQVVSLFFGGWLLFTFVEYLVHRYVYHMEASTPKKVKMQYTMHGVHHDYPKDKQRLAMPPFLSVTISTILLLIFELLLDKYSFSFLAGFLVGYAFYLLVHYSVHIFRMPNNFLKALWINHSIHHYSPEDAMFGVSSPIWDYVFGTANKKKGTGNVEVKV
jgi:sterol desaturase/sphingolipid hydroxylase (fatty acid hydroxylase superfamily)